MPDPKNGETSVYRHGKDPLEDLLALARQEIGTDRKVHGAAIVKASFVTAVDLKVKASEPPLRHADIVQWPWQLDDPEMGKAERMDRAKVIARHAEKVLFPTQ